MTALPVAADRHVSFFPVVVTGPSTDRNRSWPSFTPASARVVEARDVQAGDLILADFPHPADGGSPTSNYFTKAYHTHPTAFTESRDSCPKCTQIEDPGTAVMLTKGRPWDCDPWEAEFPVLIVPAAQATAHHLWGYLVSEANRVGDPPELVFEGPEPDAADWFLANSPLYTEETCALVTAIRLLDPHRFGPNR
ncbi:hypothetical protein ACW14Y_42030 (plasmid) [Kitasatospora sp. cg17-2]